MSSRSENAPQAQARTFSSYVWFEGSTALKEGQGVCYNWDLGTATAFDGRRYNRVELPSSTNNRHFAGVAAREYAAKSGGQLVEIYEPGSVCNVLLKADVVIGVGVITCQAGGTEAGYFTRVGFEGRGSAVPLQTVTASGTAAKGQAFLQEGLESGLVEVVTPAAGGGAQAFMVGGVTYVGAVSLTANATYTLANSTVPGLRKKFEVEGDLGDTADLVITVTSGTQRARTTEGALVALASDTMDDDNDVLLVEWQEGTWQELYAAGGTLASS